LILRQPKAALNATKQNLRQIIGTLLGRILSHGWTAKPGPVPFAAGIEICREIKDLRLE